MPATLRRIILVTVIAVTAAVTAFGVHYFLTDKSAPAAPAQTSHHYIFPWIVLLPVFLAATRRRRNQTNETDKTS
jgi:flagellar basal body-associated protein FliL